MARTLFMDSSRTHSFHVGYHSCEHAARSPRHRSLENEDCEPRIIPAVSAGDLEEPGCSLQSRGG